MRALVLSGLLLTAAAAAALPPALPPPGAAVLAVPGSWLAGFAPPATVAVRGEPLTLVNLDIMKHNVIALDVGPPDNPWCFHFATGRCPLFWSATITLGEVAAVEGLDRLPAPAAYPYYCDLHTAMEGTIVLLPGA